MKKITNEEAIIKSKKIWGNFYDYSLFTYVNARTPIKFICPKHGGSSKGELCVSKILENYNIEFVREKTFENCKFKKNLPFDFYLPSINTCIEFNGEQHYRPSKFFGGSRRYDEQIIKDNIKREYCYNNNINLVEIKYNEDINKKLTFLE